MIEFFCKYISQLKAVNYFYIKTPSMMFDKVFYSIVKLNHWSVFLVEILWTEFCFKWSFICLKSSLVACHNLVPTNRNPAPRSHIFIGNQIFCTSISLYLKFFELMSGLKFFFRMILFRFKVRWSYISIL